MGFSEEVQGIELGMPNGTLGSGLTLITGANNTGKTSITDSI